jgi:hypothetical protein
VIHPIDPNEFLQSLVKQFGTTVGVDLLMQKKKTGQDLADEYKRYVNEKSYLVVLTGLSTIEEWDDIKACFPNSKRGSRIVLSTSQIEVASLCAGQESIVSELKQLSSRQNMYAFHEKVISKVSSHLSFLHLLNYFQSYVKPLRTRQVY